MKRAALSVAGLSLLLAAPQPAIAQTDAQESAEVFAEIGADVAQFSNEEFILFLNLFAEDEEMAGMIAEVSAETLTTGPAEEGWSQRGFNIFDIIADEGEVLIDGDPDLPNVVDLTGSFAADFSGYEAYPLDDETGGAADSRFYFRFKPGAWLGFSSKTYRIDNAVCSEGWEDASVYLRGGHAALGGEDVVELAMVLAVVQSLRSMTLCEVYSRGENGILTSQIYTEEGEPMTEINSEPVNFTILPVAAANMMIGE